jgi:hypothetical protein
MDLLNPDIWKAPAALVGYWQTIVAGVFFLLGALVTITKKGRQFVRWAWAKTARSKSEPEPEPEPELQKLTLHHLFRDDFSIGSAPGIFQ